MKYWCGVVSKEHILRGVEGGFCQLCHGKRAPLSRMSVGDGIVFYSPVTTLQSKEKCQKFTAIGRVIGEEAHQFRMANDFTPFRRDIKYYAGTDTPIRPILDKLLFTSGRKNWGYQFRKGHFELAETDFLLISQRMLPHSWMNLFTSYSSGEPLYQDIPETSG